MLKLVMKDVLGNSTSKDTSFEALALLRALVVMTVWAKRDITLQSTFMLCTSIYNTENKNTLRQIKSITALLLSN